MVKCANAKGAKDSEANSAADLNDGKLPRRGLRLSERDLRADHQADVWDQGFPPDQERGVVQVGMPNGVQFRQAQMKIAGRLLADLRPNGTVRIVFIAHVGGGNECPVTARTLNGAEIIFLACGLTPGRAAALREDLERNKGVGVEIAMDESVAAKFRRAKAAGA